MTQESYEMADEKKPDSTHGSSHGDVTETGEIAPAISIEESKDYARKSQLYIIVGAMTLIMFTILLDVSILGTVSIHIPLPPPWESC